MIITVTLNPAIDKTIEIDSFQVDRVNRVKNSRSDVGGKGINVSKIINVLGGESFITGFVGGHTGEYIQNYLEQSVLDYNFIFVDGETRTNIKIVDKALGTNTDINEKGQKVSAKAIKSLKDMLKRIISKNDIVVFSGSVPEGCSNDIYFELINIAQKKGAKSILDADGELFIEGIKAKPFMVKPNNFELEKILEKKLESVESLIEGGKELLNRGIEKVVISLGEQGALFIDKEEVYHGIGEKVEVSSTVGAGDSMVAALALSEENGFDTKEKISLAIGVSSAMVTVDGTGVPSIKLVNKLKKKVKIKRY